MAQATSLPLVAVDVGNSRVKLALFDSPPAEPVPCPSQSVALAADWSDDQLIGWLPRGPDAYTWAVSSVNRPQSGRIVERLRALGASRVRVLSCSDMPIAIELPRPEQVGLDRLANALAARVLAGDHLPAVVVSVGTAITVDLISIRGGFAGGAILPSMEMGARALHEFTDQLPLVDVADPGVRVGRCTTEAMQLGLHWGAVGAVRELIGQLVDDPDRTPVFLTGGGAAGLVASLRHDNPQPPQFVPHLTLAGIALAMLAPPTKVSP